MLAIVQLHFRSPIFGSIQEDRDKVEQFHFLWNSVQKMCSSSQKVEQVLKAITVPQKLEQLHNL